MGSWHCPRSRLLTTLTLYQPDSTGCRRAAQFFTFDAVFDQLFEKTEDNDKVGRLGTNQAPVEEKRVRIWIHAAYETERIVATQH
jgi:hypothetical protein